MYMALLSAAERSFLATVSEFAYCNPFLPEHTRLEREALGAEFVEGEPVWSQLVADPERPRANVWRIYEKLKAGGGIAVAADLAEIHAARRRPAAV
jgi:hypothetical protein